MGIDVFSVYEMVCIVVFQRIKNMCYEFPVHEVVRAEQISARHEIHGRCNHVVGIFYADNINIRKIRVNYGVVYRIHKTPFREAEQSRTGAAPHSFI